MLNELSVPRQWLDGHPPAPRRKNLRVDLVGCTSVYLKYLDAWSAFIDTNNEFLIRRAIRRYERYWLTLLHQQQDENRPDAALEPPADVHWIWHLHMLQPSTYYIYCKQRFGRVLPHRFLRTESETHVSRLKTAAAWRKAFPSEPFELDLNDVEESWKFPMATRLDHLIDLAKRERNFKHRVALAHFRDQSLHFTAELRYKQLLALKQLYDWEPRCLPSDVELVWRVHMLHSIHYIEDIKQFVSQADASTSPLSTQSFLTSGINYLEHLQSSELMTFISVSNHFWKSVYPNEEHLFFVDGTTPRSMEPVSVTRSTRTEARGTNSSDVGRLVIFRSQDFDGCLVESCHITFTSLLVEELWTKQKNFKVSVKLLGVNSFQQDIVFEAKGAVGHVVTQPDKKFRVQGVKDQGFLGRCRFDPRENRGVEVQVFSCQGFGCFVRHRLLTTRVFDPLQSSALNSGSQGVASISLGQSSLKETKRRFLSSDNVNKRQQMVIPKITCTDPKMILNYRVEVSNRRPFQFVLDRNPGESTPLPNYLECLLSDVINWQEALCDFDNGTKFLVARHSLKCRDLGLAFGVEIARNDFYNLFAVSLFHNNQHLVVSAYSIDQHYLANSSQVMETCPLVLDPHRGDLAMMVRVHDGEELILISKWVEGANGGNKVHLMTYDLRSRQSHTIQIAEDEQQLISNEVVSVDLPSGRITALCSAERVPCNLVWAFCVGCLYISTQRPGNLQTLRDSTSVLSLPNGDGSGRSSSAQFSLDGSNDNSSISKRHKKRSSILQYRHNKRVHRRRKMSASFTFLLACGFRVELAPAPATSPDASITKNSRNDHNSMLDVASFSFLNDSQTPYPPEAKGPRTSSKSVGHSDNFRYFESRFDCDRVETSIFERV